MAGMHSMGGMHSGGMDMGTASAGSEATSAGGAAAASSDLDHMDHMEHADMSAAAPGRPAAMDMSKPGMAAQMKGGFHSLCTTTRACMVVFDKDASGTASVLGVKTTLTGLTATKASLRVSGRAVVLHKGKAVEVRGLTLKIIRIDAAEVAIRVTKAK